MKIVITFLILTVCLFNLVQCRTDPFQQSIISPIIESLYAINPVIDPCVMGQYVICEKTDSNNSSSYQTITTLNFFYQSNQLLISDDITLLPNLTSIVLNENIVLSVSFFQNMHKLSQLDKLELNFVNYSLPDNLKLPPSVQQIYLNQVFGPLDRIWFDSYVESIIIDDVSSNYSFPSNLKVNGYLTTAQFPITYFAGVPSNLSQIFPNLANLYFLINNDIDIDGYTDISIPITTAFENLEDLEFTFNYEENYQSIILSHFFSYTPILNNLYIYGNGFVIDPTVGYIDFSNIKLSEDYRLYLTFEDSDSIFSSCKSSPCFKNLPNYSEFFSSYCSYPFDLIDFKNLGLFTVYYNNYEQRLPNIDNSLLNKFVAQRSIIVGDIPDSYCKIIITLKNDQLNGTVPDCIQCVGGANAGFVLPNPFSNFNALSQPYCPGFHVNDDYNQLFPTDGTGVMNITGTNLGWSSPPLVAIVPNSIFKIIIPRNTGTHKQVNVVFSNGQTHSFNVSFIPPTIKSYGSLEYEGLLVFTLNGTGFNFIEENNITINGISYNFTRAIGGGTEDNLIGYPLSDFPSFSNETQFTVFATVDGQISNEISFYYFRSIEVYNENLVLNNTGGSIDIDGSFGTNNVSMVSISINGTKCSVSSMTTTKLTINYPPNQPANNLQLLLNIGGFAVNIPVSYIQVQTPIPSTTSSSTSSSTTSSPTTSSTTTSSTTTSSTTTSSTTTLSSTTTASTTAPSSTTTGDDGSNSSIITISFNLIVLLLLIQQFI
ncbi:hypothetical protein ACTA71_000461 [Dictyostelium dimigraforme]